jgi:methionyl-tRNA formyltransferase
MKLRSTVIGSGSFAARCLRQLISSESFEVNLVVIDPTTQSLSGLIENFCGAAKIPFITTPTINEPESLKTIRDATPDYIFNIYGMQILSSQVLDAAKYMAINFHNGPLPRYRGVNVYSWAIINGEADHGVTWHEIDRGIDTGPILTQEFFPIESDDTPTSLVRKGFDAGTKAFARLLAALKVNQLRPILQNHRRASVYSRRDLPNGGLIDFSWPFAELERFFRGLDFRPLPNRFVHPTAAFRGARFHARSIESVSMEVNHDIATIVSIGDSKIEVQTKDRVIAIGDLLTASLQPVTPNRLASLAGISVGDKLDYDSAANFYESD